jgi:hypothetical protein
MFASSGDGCNWTGELGQSGVRDAINACTECTTGLVYWGGCRGVTGKQCLSGGFVLALDWGIRAVG